ncbi:unnamed protein product [Microthlaspi erraticum]|uniref:F-box domain-containing protein n=1 Tax=Microthlaspi erraticum TaxID=1685480 RepID=A0A6D2IJZ9_9BRAS|nr:unnamed protein product [Microthlaspi erraticum]
MLSDLPRDLAEEVLSRLPMTCNRAVRSVCKRWNTLSKGRGFTKKHLARVKAAAARESTTMVVVVISHRLYLMSVNLHKGVDTSFSRQGKLISSLEDDYGDGVDIFQVYHCDGLLFCLTKGQTRFVVWNPYSGQTRWFKPLAFTSRMRSCNYAIGYEESSSRSSRRRSYKVLRFGESFQGHVRYGLYYVNSYKDDVTTHVTILTDWFVECDARGVSLNGNTYWFAQGKMPPGVDALSASPDFLICFDFTTERFGPHLTVPFRYNTEDTVTLSSVGDEQLAVLHQDQYTLRMQIWITTKIEPQVVWWSKLCFLAVDMEPLVGDPFDSACFFVDEEKKLAVVLENDMVAYIVGEDGYLKKEDLGGSSNICNDALVYSLVPSLAQIKRLGTKRKKSTRFQLSF